MFHIAPPKKNAPDIGAHETIFSHSLRQHNLDQVERFVLSSGTSQPGFIGHPQDIYIIFVYPHYSLPDEPRQLDLTFQDDRV